MASLDIRIGTKVDTIDRSCHVRVGLVGFMVGLHIGPEWDLTMLVVVQ
jgi:hypothetical protein